jgi:hypothetical protein
MSASLPPSRRSALVVSACASVLLAATGAPAAEVTWSLRSGPDLRARNPDSPFDAASGLTGAGSREGRGELVVRAKESGLTLAASARLTSTFDTAKGSTSGELRVQELFYDAALLGSHFGAGKRVLPWDVGHSFRPLDVVQHEDRRAFDPWALEGVPMLTWEKFGSEVAWSLVWANPLQGQGAEARDDQAIAARLYAHQGVLDLHLVARYSERDRLGAGLGVAAVLGDRLEVHASGFYQQRFERRTNPLAAAGAGPLLAPEDPTQLETHLDGFSGLVGGSYTWDEGFTLLAEAFHDPAAARASDWRDLASLARRQAALLAAPGVPRDAVTGNLAWSARLFDSPNLLRDNLVVRASFKSDDLEPAVDALWSPADGGWALGGSVAWLVGTSRLEAGARLFAGPADSAVRLLPERGMLYASWKLIR